MFATGFQSFAFQTVGSGNPVPSVVLLGGGPGEEHRRHYPSYAELRDLDIQHRISGHRNELKEVDTRLSEAEHEKKRLALKKRAKAQILAASLQDEIDRLRKERAWLIRRIDDDEAILILMMMKKRRLI